MTKIIMIFSLLWATSALAQFSGCKIGFCQGYLVGGGPPTTNFLLSNAGSFLLSDTNSKFLVQ